MNLVEYHCPNCNAALKLDPDGSDAVCEYCGSVFKINDEKRDAEQEGYDFEFGRMRAREEMNGYSGQPYPTGYTQTKKNMTWLWVLGWIFCFPIPLTVIIVRSKKLHPIVKAVLLLILWGFIILAGLSEETDNTGSQSTQTSSARITTVYQAEF